MIKEIFQDFNEAFSESSVERAFKKHMGDDPRVVKLLRTLAILRFLLFPVSLLIYLLSMILTLIVIISTSIGLFLETAFGYTSDSMWLNLTWFGLGVEELAFLAEQEVKENGGEANED